VISDERKNAICLHMLLGRFGSLPYKITFVTTHLKKSRKVREFQSGQGKVKEMSEKTVLGLPLDFLFWSSVSKKALSLNVFEIGPVFLLKMRIFSTPFHSSPNLKIFSCTASPKFWKALTKGNYLSSLIIRINVRPRSVANPEFWNMGSRWVWNENWGGGCASSAENFLKFCAKIMNFLCKIFTCFNMHPVKTPPLPLSSATAYNTSVTNDRPTTDTTRTTDRKA